MRHACILAALAVSLCSAKDNKTQIIIRAISHDAQVHQNRSTYTTPGTATTNCTGSATTVGDTTNGTASCQTTSTPAQTHEIVTSYADITNEVVGNGMRYLVTCRNGWRGSKCAPMIDGETFPAEIEGTTMWVEARVGGNQGKKVRVKYRILDIRPEQE